MDSVAAIHRQGTSRNNLQIRGTNENINSALQSAEQKAWLYVGKINMKCTTEDVMKFLSDKFPGKKSQVELISNEGSSSRAFKVGIDYKLLEEVSKPEFWPQGVTVRRYRFFRGQRRHQG